MRSIRLHLSRLACVLLVGLSIAGCGGFGTSTPAPTNSMTLKVAQVSNVAGFFPLYVALQKNYFKAQGLTLDPPIPIQTGTGAKMAALMESGGAELGGGGLITDAFTLSRVDSQIKLLGALTTGNFSDVIASKRFTAEAHLSANMPLEAKVKALVGKKLGITQPGSGTHAVLIYLFRQFGFDLEHDATVVSLNSGSPAAAVQALAAGRIDAVCFPSPAGQIAEAQSAGDIFISPERGDIPDLVGETQAVIYAKQSVIDAKPKAVQAYIRAIAQADAFIHQHPDQAEVLFGTFVKLDPKIAKSAFTAILPILPLTPQITQQGYNAANQFHVKAGLIAVPLAYKDMVATDTINNALRDLPSSS